MVDKKQLPIPEEDGLKTPVIGAWGQDKYRLVAIYDTLFSSGMKDKWEKRVYIDLYAGAGKAKLKNSNLLVYGSPMLALMVPHQFDKYIFCDADGDNITALRARVEKLGRSPDVSFITGDCNEKTSEILAAIPPYSSTCRVLNLCFIDPFNLGIQFGTIQKLADRFMDFLVLLMDMDVKMNEHNYIQPKSQRIEQFLGEPAWRDKWKVAQENRVRFSRFVIDEFANSMQRLGYDPPTKMKAIHSDEKNLLLYHLALFSRHPLAYKFWKDALKYSDPQEELF